MIRKFVVFVVCALLISIVAAAPAVERNSLKEKCEELGSAAQMEGYRKFSASRFRVGDYLKIQCEVKPPILLEKQDVYLGEQRLETKSEGKNIITVTHRITAEDRSEYLSCNVLTAPTRPEDQIQPNIALTYTYLSQNAVNN